MLEAARCVTRRVEELHESTALVVGYARHDLEAARKTRRGEGDRKRGGRMAARARRSEASHQTVDLLELDSALVQ
jgi:hypothetical protein